MRQLAPDDQRTLTDLASRYGVSTDAVHTLLQALQESGGQQAQFDHPELGGMGQWSRGGMIMIGDMFNSTLKARVDDLCRELSAWLDGMQGISGSPSRSQSHAQGSLGGSIAAVGSGSGWWPVELGTPTALGAQNDLRYAYFAATRRLVINQGSRISIYDTRDHHISGVSQQQGPDQLISFTSQHGPVRLADLRLIATDSEEPRLAFSGPEPRDALPEPVPATLGDDPLPGHRVQPETAEGDILAAIERLAELRRRDILTEQEFTAKKTELLSRL